MTHAPCVRDNSIVSNIQLFTGAVGFGVKMKGREGATVRKISLAALIIIYLAQFDLTLKAKFG